MLRFRRESRPPLARVTIDRTDHRSPVPPGIRTPPPETMRASTPASACRIVCLVLYLLQSGVGRDVTSPLHLEDDKPPAMSTATDSHECTATSQPHSNDHGQHPKDRQAYGHGTVDNGKYLLVLSLYDDRQGNDAETEDNGNDLLTLYERGFPRAWEALQQHTPRLVKDFEFSSTAEIPCNVAFCQRLESSLKRKHLAQQVRRRTLHFLSILERTVVHFVWAFITGFGVRMHAVLTLSLRFQWQQG